MLKVLVPFADVDSGERVIRELLKEGPSPELEVELLAVVELVHFDNGRALSRDLAEQASRATATCWLARLGPMLDAAHIPHRSCIAVGQPAAEIEAAVRRTDVDRVVLTAAAPRWPAVQRPITLVE
ncbi:MAG TPA: hypothetical protein VFB54_07910 [Burkholderiales bacterium]|nr:hypothetical protein [Burkholderiales bacterium]